MLALLARRIRERMAPSEVLLTFDDGPHPEFTPIVLDVLAAEQIQAVFFVCGEKLLSSKAFGLVKRARDEGHLIGNHSYDHVKLTTLGKAEIQAQILATHELIKELEPPQKLFRPPYGAYNEDVTSVLKEMGYQLVLWNVDPQDWSSAMKPKRWVERATRQILWRRHAVCICHDVHSTTAEYLPYFIKTIRARQRVAFVKWNRHDVLSQISNLKS